MIPDKPSKFYNPWLLPLGIILTFITTAIGSYAICLHGGF
jgi:hypothetical protein